MTETAIAPRGDLRPGEETVPLPDDFGAQLYFIGRIGTPFKDRSECPRQGDRLAGPLCTIDIDPRWEPALAGIAACDHLQVLYWLALSRRDVVLQNPGHSGALKGTFALRSPLRPNPIASSVVKVERVEGPRLIVRGLDCVDGTPLLDLKPERCPEAP